MSIYSGNRSLDAEIKLNFIDETITMDYSLNKFGSPYSSNHSVILNNSCKRQPILIRIKCALIGIFATIIAIPVFSFMPVMSFMAERGIIGKNGGNFQYKVQKLYRWVLVHGRGIYEQSYSGKLNGNVLAFHIPNNLWVSYELSGEYEDKIASMSLSRNFVKHKIGGEFECLKQDGWNVIFEFVTPPESGSCCIEYVSFSR
jgi:hypothetical protein